ncbi:unnamed protein product [Phytophthora lilii]|uniref:Unnamed protein product n=1 Tax=Phytophthora lilii TaxID=2077276 RepID=A0A9W6WT59_9STRA|nr:unnamed protein product [Phytophthora lilii]
MTSASSSAPSPAATNSTTSCTTSQISSIVSLYTDAAKSSSCAPDSTTTSYSVYVFTKFASSCASQLKTLAGDLSNCYYDYEISNKKASLQTIARSANYISTTVFLSTTTASSGADTSRQLGFSVALITFVAKSLLLARTHWKVSATLFERSLQMSLIMQRLSLLVLVTILTNVISVAAWSSASSSSSSESVNASSWTPSTRNCSTQEITIMRKLYVGVAANTACASGSTVDKNEIYVSSECTSMCLPVLENLEEALPDCYYFLTGYENSNKKWDAYSSLAQCDQWIVPAPVWVRFHSNKTISVPTPSSASGSAIMDDISAPSASGSEMVGSTSSSSTVRGSWLVAMVVAALAAP